MYVLLCPHCCGVKAVAELPAGGGVTCGDCTRPFPVAAPPPTSPAEGPADPPATRGLSILRPLPPGE